MVLGIIPNTKFVYSLKGASRLRDAPFRKESVYINRCQRDGSEYQVRTCCRTFLSTKQISYKRKKTESIGFHIIIYKIVTVHIALCLDPFRYRKSIHRICISYESHNLASFNMFFFIYLYFSTKKQKNYGKQF